MEPVLRHGGDRVPYRYIPCPVTVRRWAAVWCYKGAGGAEWDPWGRGALVTVRRWAAVWCYKGAGGAEWDPWGRGALVTVRRWAAVWAYTGTEHSYES